MASMGSVPTVKHLGETNRSRPYTIHHTFSKRFLDRWDTSTLVGITGNTQVVAHFQTRGFDARKRGDTPSAAAQPKARGHRAMDWETFLRRLSGKRTKLRLPAFR